MTRKGAWDLQEVRDKYLEDGWVNVYGLYVVGGGYDGVNGAIGPAYNRAIQYSSPAQIDGTTWASTMPNSNHYAKFIAHTKTDGSLWSWGYNTFGVLGINQNNNKISSPVQLPGSTWPKTNLWEKMCISNNQAYAIKTNGTLWAWGSAYKGNTAQNDGVTRSSPAQVGTDTTWAKVTKGAAIKTDGTLWLWGSNSDGGSGQGADRSSPVQQGTATTWAQVTKGSNAGIATKTDGTLWVWGANPNGNLGLNDITQRNSIVQLGTDTTWSTAAGAIATNSNGAGGAIKQDGTLWVMGRNTLGALGLNNLTAISSPTQVPGTNWSTLQVDYNNHMRFYKSDGTAWATGRNTNGQINNNDRTQRSSPTQIPGVWQSFGGGLNYAAGSRSGLSAL